MEKNANDLSFTREIIDILSKLEETIPDSVNHFTEMSKSALKSGALDKKTKFLIALSISIMKNSQSCIKYHMQNLILQGLSYQELLELVSIALYMGGGPALISGQYAIEQYLNCSKPV